MIKILHVVNRMTRGGAETFIMNVYRNIDRKKFKFIFLCHSEVAGEYDEEIIKLGGEIVYLPNPKIFSVYKYIRDLKNFLCENKIDVVHSHVGFFSGIVCYAAKMAGVNVRISHAHTAGSIDKVTVYRKMYNNLMRKLINETVTHKIACGEKAGKYIFENDYQIIYNGINLEKYKNIDISYIKEEFRVENEMIIGHIGRFSKVKNQDFFIKLANYFDSMDIKYKILLVGDGELFDSFKKKIEDMNLAQKIILTGSRSDVPALLNMFDVFVMPSLYEGFPVTIVEALAAGLPCILSDSITKEVNLIDGACTFIDLNDSIDIWCSEIIKKASYKFDKKQNSKILSQNGLSIEHVFNQLSEIYEGRK